MATGLMMPNEVSYRALPEATLPHLLAVQAARTPYAIALVHGQETLTYRALHDRANALAQRLMEMGAGPGSVVGVCLERSVGLAVAILAIHKAGAAYLPLSTCFPRARITYMTADSGASLIVTDAAHLDLTTGTPVETLLADAAVLTGNDPAEATVAWVLGSDAACILYTFDVFAEPQSLTLTHEDAIRLLKTTGRGMTFTRPLNDPQSIPELFRPLADGGTVVLPGPVTEPSEAVFFDVQG